jgi:selenocysteine-specific elongation factor
MKPTRSIVVGTAGHIDHGKTALVRALTGIDTDRLPEEKRRGITIDLGFASLDVSAPDQTQLRISFVDVPGHALFIRNMLAGAGCVPAVILVIAADEGVMPQTREHLAICQLLGISDGFTVITKADLVSESQLATTCNQIAAFLDGTFLDPGTHAIIAASAHSGSGLDAVRAELTALALRARAAESGRPMRLPIDRTFVKKGFGTVVTGTLISGEVRTGENFVLEPGARHVRVRGLQAHGESEEAAFAGSRVAVNLSGIDAAEISRGQTLVAAGDFATTDAIDAEIILLDGAPPLKPRARVHLHIFTSEVMATVLPYGNEAVQPGATRLARIKLSSPVVLAPGDRFVLRQPLPAGTVGGGRVLDAHPLHVRRVETQAWLEQIAPATPERQLLLRVHRRGVQGISFNALASEMGLTTAAARELASSGIESGDILVIASANLISCDAFVRACDHLLSHVKSCGPAGLKRSELQTQTRLSAAVLAAVLDRLVAERQANLAQEVVTLAGAAPAISGKDAQKLHNISDAYLASGLAAPSVREAAQQLRMPEAEMRRLITLMLREKTLVRMGSDDSFVHADSLKRLVARVSAMRGQAMDVAAFKALTGLTRKHAIPLLEYLDRERITRKQGDLRIIL